MGDSSTSSPDDAGKYPVCYVHTSSETGRLLPRATESNSIEIDLDVSTLPPPYSKSYEFELVIADKTHYKRFLYTSLTLASLVLALGLVLHFLPRKHHHRGHSKNLTLAVNQAITFFDAQKSGSLPSNSPVSFRGSSGLQDGNSSHVHADLVGGFYDSGNNIKFTFPTAYTITLLSWSVIEYHQKYKDIGELEHIKDIIKWGSDYLLKVFVPPSAKSDPTILYSQVGSAAGSGTKYPVPNDINCWQRPEDMSYERPVSVCNETASDLAGEIIAALSAASIVFKQDNGYSQRLVKTAEKIYGITEKEDRIRRAVTYTTIDACGGNARRFYDSSGYKDELVWGATWLLFATGNNTYLEYATKNFAAAADNETMADKGIFYWNNKITANVVLFARLRFFHDPGFPYEKALGLASTMTDQLMCSYLEQKSFNRTPGGLILLRPDNGGQLQFAATASFLSKLYNDYLTLLRRSGWNCTDDGFSLEMLKSFSTSQINYILGDNTRKMSYMVGFGDRYPTQVHHRSASIPWDGQYHSCAEGDRWLHSRDQNPNILLGAMVAGPDRLDDFSDERDKPWFTEPSIASNAGLVAALIAHLDPPSSASNGTNLGLDLEGIFDRLHLDS